MSAAAAVALAPEAEPTEEKKPRRGGRKKSNTWTLSVRANDKIKKKVRRVQKIHRFATEAEAVRYMLEYLVPDA